MLWKGRRTSSNVDDRRAVSGKKVALGGGLGAIVVALVMLFLGGDTENVLQNLQNSISEETPGQERELTSEERELGEFVSVVLADTEDVWNELFRREGREGREYREPQLVLFSGSVESACGYAGTAVGPFYCSADEKVYIDLEFFSELEERFRAGGDFARAYVIAHEIGHHVQNLLGILPRVHEEMRGLEKSEANKLLVRLELQADFFAGIWAHHAQRMKNIIEDGDIEEALNAASAVGDDRIQKRERGYVVPDSFTHGTSAQRLRWFKLGLQSGDLSRGNTFEAGKL